MATVSMPTRVPKEIADRYTRLAKATGRTRSHYVNEALAESIDRLEYEYGILKKVEDFRAGRLETVTLDELEESLDLANRDR
ncbi:MAG: ribbon-helix-helix domain-containing protein [Olsenella sp.]|nr:ribbon-helix-helix domain-containing protein [Olsenella sp.]